MGDTYIIIWRGRFFFFVNAYTSCQRFWCADIGQVQIEKKIIRNVYVSLCLYKVWPKIIYIIYRRTDVHMFPETDRNFGDRWSVYIRRYMVTLIIHLGVLARILCGYTTVQALTVLPDIVRAKDLFFRWYICKKICQPYFY